MEVSCDVVNGWHCPAQIHQQAEHSHLHLRGEPKPLTNPTLCVPTQDQGFWCNPVLVMKLDIKRTEFPPTAPEERDTLTTNMIQYGPVNRRPRGP